MYIYRMEDAYTYSYDTQMLYIYIHTYIWCLIFYKALWQTLFNFITIAKQELLAQLNKETHIQNSYFVQDYRVGK